VTLRATQKSHTNLGFQAAASPTLPRLALRPSALYLARGRRVLGCSSRLDCCSSWLDALSLQAAGPLGLHTLERGVGVLGCRTPVLRNVCVGGPPCGRGDWPVTVRAHRLPRGWDMRGHAPSVGLCLLCPASRRKQRYIRRRWHMCGESVICPKDYSSLKLSTSI
jgi:hypothetical protein